MTTTDPDLAILTHPDALAFRARICREPEDDTHRLVFADWLDERGDAEWAELIRVQCELATANPAIVEMVKAVPTRNWEATAYSRVAMLLTRESTLLPRIEPRLRRGPVCERRGPVCERCGGNGQKDGWLQDPDRPNAEKWKCPTCRGTGHTGTLGERDSWYRQSDPPHEPEWLIPATWSRGFVAGITCPLAWWMQHGRDVVREWPVTEVECSDKQPREWTGENGERDWVWVVKSESQIETPMDIPRSIFAHLKGGTPNRGNWVMRYHTEAAARASLSAACVACARGEG